MLKKFLFSLAATLFLCACNETSSFVASDRVVVDKAMWLNDGQAIFWSMEPGRYKLEMTASADGASVEWIGASCPGTGEVKQFSTICDMQQTGQVIIKNPTVLGLGANTSVTIKITHLAK